MTLAPLVISSAKRRDWAGVDLRLHDLRHEGISHYFELGEQIQQVAMVSGHKSWSMLQHYTHLYEYGVFDKYENWEWLKVLKAEALSPVFKSQLNHSTTSALGGGASICLFLHISVTVGI